MTLQERQRLEDRRKAQALDRAHEHFANMTSFAEPHMRQCWLCSYRRQESEPEKHHPGCPFAGIYGEVVLPKLSDDHFFVGPFHKYRGGPSGHKNWRLVCHTCRTKFPPLTAILPANADCCAQPELHVHNTSQPCWLCR